MFVAGDARHSSAPSGRHIAPMGLKLYEEMVFYKHDAAPQLWLSNGQIIQSQSPIVRVRDRSPIRRR